MSCKTRLFTSLKSVICPVPMRAWCSSGQAEKDLCQQPQSLCYVFRHYLPQMVPRLCEMLAASSFPSAAYSAGRHRLSALFYYQMVDTHGTDVSAGVVALKVWMLAGTASTSGASGAVRTSVGSRPTTKSARPCIRTPPRCCSTPR